MSEQFPERRPDQGSEDASDKAQSHTLAPAGANESADPQEPVDAPSARDRGVAEDTTSEEPQTDGEAPKTARDHAERLVNAAADRIVPTAIPNGRLMVVVVVVAALFLINSDWVRPYITGEVPYAQMVERGTVEEQGRQTRQMVMDEFEPWMKVSYLAVLDEQSYRGRVLMIVDPVCTYCQRAFEDTEALNAAGISVEYVVVPMNVENELSMAVAESVYCTPEHERKAAFESEMSQAAWLAPECEAGRVIEVQEERARALGAGSARPYAVTDDGRAVTGYLPPAEWVTIFDNAPAETENPEGVR